MKLAIFFFALFSSYGVPETVNANEVAYKTYIDSFDGFHETQPAYEAIQVISNNQIKKIEDILIHDHSLLVVDSGQPAIMQLDFKGNKLKEIKNQKFKQPTGIAVDQSGNLYVADSGAETVFKLTANGKLLQEFTKPTEPLFGKKQVFKPKKIKLDVRGNLYIVGEGATNGIIQLNSEGEFLGYFGSNMAGTTLFSKLQQTILSKVRVGNHLMNVPAAASNIDIDSKGVIYTVTSVNQAQNIKKLNVAGMNMLSPGTYAPEKAIDIKVGALNNFFVLTSEGLINEFSSTGDLLFSMGSNGVNSQRLGIYKDPSAIAIQENGTLFVADREEGVIHQLVPTDFAKEVHKGLVLFEEGRYLESKQYWENVSRMNNYFSIAHNATGQALLREQQYDAAKNSFKEADNRQGYSTAFWEIRNIWLEKNLGNYLMGLILIFIIWQLAKYIHKKTNFLKPVVKKVEALKKYRLLQELGVVFHMLRHPLDAFYQIKKEQKTSPLSASILLGILVAEFITFLYCTGYIFNQEWTKQYHLFLLLAFFIGGILLFVLVNYLVATISDGEGALSKVFMGTVYSLAPLIVGILPLILVSNLLTLNEAFLFDYSLTVMLTWSFVLLIMMIKEIHHFTLGETIKNLLLTIFTIVIILSVSYILFILSTQLIHFVQEIIQEVLTRG